MDANAEANGAKIEDLTAEVAAAMSSQERVTLINDLSARQVRGDELSDDELRAAMRLLLAERAARTGEAKAAGKGKAPRAPSVLDKLGLD